MAQLLRSCAVNYRNALKQIFTVLGILFLSILLGCSALVTQVKASVTGLIESVTEDYQQADLSLGHLAEAVEKRAEEIGIGDIISVIEKKSLMPLVEGRIERALRLTLDNYESFADKLQTDVAVCAAGFCIAVAALLLILFLGMIISFFTADLTVRARIGKEKISRVLLEMLVRSAGYAAAAAIVYGLYSLSPDNWKIFVCLLPFLIVLFGMLASWLAARKDGITLKSVITFRNYFGLLAADLLMIAASAVLAWLLYKLFNPVVANVVMIALAVVTLAALDLSTTGCVEEVKKLTAQAE